MKNLMWHNKYDLISTLKFSGKQLKDLNKGIIQSLESFIDTVIYKKKYILVFVTFSRT